MNNLDKNNPSTYKQLFRLENLDDWKVHHDDIDIRDYDVKTADGKTIGEVENLLVDLEGKKVRYVEIEMEDDSENVASNSGVSYTEADGDRMLIIPVGLVEINNDDKCVHIEGLHATDFNAYPRYKRETALTPNYEKSVHDYLIGAPSTKTITDSKDDDGAIAVGNVDFNRSKYDSPYFRDSKYRTSALRTSMTKNS